VAAAEDQSTPARKLFGTDGIRGRVNHEPITCETALSLGKAVALLCKRDPTRRHTILIGRDTRCSGDMLEGALTAGICSMGVDVLLAGVVPTPAIAFLTRTIPVSTGVMISASHNPFADNGFKFFGNDGFKLPHDAEQEIEAIISGGRIGASRPRPEETGRMRSLDNAAVRYVKFLEQAGGRALDGLKIVVDCGHGAAYRVGPQVFRDLGAQVIAIGVSPDGTNINDGCGALHIEQLQNAVITERAHAGVALDGDADRLIMVDEHGAALDGDELLAMMSAEMLSRGTLRHGIVVATVMSNIGLEVALHERGARLVRVPVGDRYVVEEMRRHDCNLGGEQSGHLVLLDQNTTGDGLISALAVVRLMLERERPLSDLKGVMRKFPQQLISVPVKHRQDLNAVAPLRQLLDRIAAEMNGRGRVLVRYSGTEPVVRIMVEGEELPQVRAYAAEIAALVQSHLGTPGP
jgi:phosphoglucosamine mutase